MQILSPEVEQKRVLKMQSFLLIFNMAIYAIYIYSDVYLE